MRAKDIRQTLAELALDTNEYRINAGGAMVLYGLREETHDLDIWCTKKLGDVLAQRCAFETMPDGTRRFVPAPDVEIYENLQPGETVLLDGIPVASLREVLAFKRSLNREKDQKDIAVLEAAVAAQTADFTVAPIQTEDIASCTAMYNYYIENTRITLEEDPRRSSPHVSGAFPRAIRTLSPARMPGRFSASPISTCSTPAAPTAARQIFRST